MRYFIVFFIAYTETGVGVENDASISAEPFPNRDKLVEGCLKRLQDQFPDEKFSGITFTNILEITEMDYKSWCAK